MTAFDRSSFDICDLVQSRVTLRSRRRTRRCRFPPDWWLRHPRVMEETGMCLVTRPPATDHPPSTTSCPAKTLGPRQRQRLAVEALAGAVPITELADHARVSRRF